MYFSMHEPPSVWFLERLLGSSPSIWSSLYILGLVVRDIEIIQYFCFTQREWPARVVLCHWKLLKDKRRQVPCFNFYNLRLMMQEIGRNDILKIVDYSDTNCYEDNDDNLCTHLWVVCKTESKRAALVLKVKFLSFEAELLLTLVLRQNV